jgi:predicted anti-sigma-YlaC factor YlaD
MHLSAFRQWIRNVYATQDDELGCDQVLQALPEYVDSEVAGEDLSQRSREVKAHLNQCAECYDLYITVRDAAFVERESAVSKIAAD